MTLPRRALVRLAVAAAGAAGAGALAVVLVDGGPVKPSWTTIGFLVVLLAAQLFPLHLTHEADSEALRLEEVLLVPMSVLLAPQEILPALAASVAVASLAHRRGLLKGVFNVGAVTASAGAGLLASAALRARYSGPGPELVSGVAAGLVFCVVSAVAVAGIIALSQGERWWSVLRDGAGIRIATWAGSLSLGLLVTMAARADRVALVVAVLPAVVLQAAYGGALRQWRERRTAESLYDAARRLHGTMSSDAVRAGLVDAARSLVAAADARVVDSSAPLGDGVLRVAVDDGSSLEVSTRATGGAWTEQDERRLQALAAVAAGALANAMLYEQVRAITQSLGEGVLAVDENAVVTFANPAAEQLLGWAPGGLVGQPVTAVDGGTHPEDGWLLQPRLLAGETVRLDEHVLSRADSRPLDVALTAAPVLRDGAVVGAVVVLRDVRERLALERRLAHQAFHDPLTGLPNRALFLDRLEHARLRARTSPAVQAVLFLDIDRFKVINDSLGHRAGDDVLVTVASRLATVLQERDTVARFGGDEFAVLLEDLPTPSEATVVADRVVRVLREPVPVAGRDVVLSASIGVAVAEPFSDSGDLLAAADIAMYEAKSAGKNRWSVASAGADDRARARLDLEQELRLGIAQDQLELHYQPVVGTRTGGLHGLEALVRWRHPTLGLLAPSAFMELAEDSGLVLPLGAWVLEQACRDLRGWHDRHPGSATHIAVNLSARQFQQPDLREQVAEVLARTGVDPSLLVLEITETVIMRDTEDVLATLDALRSLRVGIAVDDFGTGFSSLSYLKRFPVDTIKVDKSFVDGLGSSAVDREIVSAVVRLADAVGLHTVAEGVETTRQLDQLRSLGCSSVQGYLVAAPQPLRDVERVLGDRIRVPSPRQATGRLRALS